MQGQTEKQTHSNNNNQPQKKHLARTITVMSLKRLYAHITLD